MKSLKYLAIALAVAGVAAAATPVYAGSVGANGGSKSTTRVIDNVHRKDTYEDKYKKGSDIINQGKDVINKGVKTGNTYTTAGKDIVSGGSTKVVVNVYRDHDIWGGNSGPYFVEQKKFDSINQAKANVGSMACDAAYAGRVNAGYSCSNLSYHTDGYNLNGNTHAVYSSGEGWLGWNKNHNLSGGSYSGSSKEYTGTTYDNYSYKTRNVKVDSKITDTGKDKITDLGWDAPKLTKQTYKFNEVTYKFSDDAIVVGDTDNYNNMMVAQGSVVRENHVDRTDYYHNVHNFLTQDIKTRTDYYDQYKDTYRTSHKNYKNNQTYTVDMHVSVTPIVLDLDGDGKIEASNGQYLPHSASEISKNIVMFDFYGNGFPVVMEWVGTNDGLLCRPNADGTVKGTNLFGSSNGYENGYDELASLDVDKDGSLMGAELEGIMVWQDENHNGVADKGELKSLESLGITSISTVNRDMTGIYTRNGKNYKTFDWCPIIQKVRKTDVAR